MFHQAKWLNTRGFKGGFVEHQRFPEWQGKRVTYLISMEFEVARWFFWAPMQKATSVFISGGDLELAQFRDVLHGARQACDGFKVDTDAPSTNS